MNIVAAKEYFPDDLLRMPDGDQYELVDGQLRERGMGAESSWIGGQIVHILAAFCKANRVGWVWPADIGYQCFPNSPNTVRKPDVSVIRFGRLPGERLPKGNIAIAPDLAVEVISPNELSEEVDAKIEQYLGAGVGQVWVVSPGIRTVQIYRPDGSTTRLRVEDELAGEGPLEGFHHPIRDFFPPD